MKKKKKKKTNYCKAIDPLRLGLFLKASIKVAT
jgi:hypothetical protein